MERVTFVGEALRADIIALIKKYEEEYGVEFVQATFKNYYSIVNQANEIHSLVSVKEK